MKCRLLLFALSVSLACGWVSCRRAHQGQDQHPLYATKRVREFLRQGFAEGIPPSSKDYLGAGAIPILEEVISRPDFELYHKHAVAALGIIGDPRALPQLISYVESARGEISRDRFEALLNSQLAIGHLAAQNDMALRYLLDRTSVNFWNNRPWKLGAVGSLQGVFMTRAVLNGLGVSGRVEALSKLKTLRKRSGELLEGSIEDNIGLNEKMALRVSGSRSMGDTGISCAQVERSNVVADHRDNLLLPNAELVTQPISIARHISANIDERAAEKVLDQASVLLQKFDGPGDFECSVKFEKDGGIGRFGIYGDGDDYVQYPSQLAKILCMPGRRIKIVTSISGYNLCGTSGEGSFAGCAERPGNNIIMKPSVYGDIWAHEFGHNKGLEHRDDADAIMHSTASGTTEVKEFECNKFKVGGRPSFRPRKLR